MIQYLSDLATWTQHPGIVVYFNPGCGPCKRLYPELEKINTCDVFLIDRMEMSIPNLLTTPSILFSNGQGTLIQYREQHERNAASISRAFREFCDSNWTALPQHCTDFPRYSRDRDFPLPTTFAQLEFIEEDAPFENIRGLANGNLLPLISNGLVAILNPGCPHCRNLTPILPDIQKWIPQNCVFTILVAGKRPNVPQVEYFPYFAAVVHGEWTELSHPPVSRNDTHLQFDPSILQPIFKPFFKLTVDDNDDDTRIVKSGRHKWVEKRHPRYLIWQEEKQEPTKNYFY
jgi:hypothetical protein